MLPEKVEPFLFRIRPLRPFYRRSEHRSIRFSVGHEVSRNERLRRIILWAPESRRLRVGTHFFAENRNKPPSEISNARPSEDFRRVVARETFYQIWNKVYPGLSLSSASQLNTNSAGDWGQTEWDRTNSVSAQLEEDDSSNILRNAVIFPFFPLKVRNIACNYHDDWITVKGCPILTKCPSLLRPWWTGNESPLSLKLWTAYHLQSYSPTLLRARLYRELRHTFKTI